MDNSCKYELLNLTSDDVDFEEAKKEIEKQYKERASLFSFYESPTGELYLKLCSPERFRKPEGVLLRLKETIEKMPKKIVYTLDEVLFKERKQKAHDDFVRLYGREPEPDEIFILLE